MTGCLAAAAAYAGLVGLLLWFGRRLRRYRDLLREGECGGLCVSH